MAPKKLTGTSLGAVTSWTWNNFSDDFTNSRTCKDYTLQRFHLPAFGNNGQFKGIVVRTASEEIREDQRATVEVLTWLEGHQIAVGYISRMGWKTHAVSCERVLDANIRFNAPFSWILDAVDETAVMRFESLIRHGFLARGFRNAIKGKGNFAKLRDHFPGACRDVAQKATAISAEWERITAPLEPSGVAYIEQIWESSDIVPDVECSPDDLLIFSSSPAEPVVPKVAPEIPSNETRAVSVSAHSRRAEAKPLPSQQMCIPAILDAKDVGSKTGKPRAPVVAPHTMGIATSPLIAIAATASFNLNGLDVLTSAAAEKRHISSGPPPS